MEYYFRLTRIDGKKVVIPRSEIVSVVAGNACTDIETSKILIQVKEDLLEIETMIEHTGVTILDTELMEEFDKLPF
tara:strand:+ start:1804 stop:2031 length:228 start_codon:yes stop_codon:yes gene_type:complete